MKTQGNVTMTTVVNIVHIMVQIYAHPCRQISNVQAQRIATSLTKNICRKRPDKMEAWRDAHLQIIQE